MRQESRLSMQVPHSTQSLPPAFSAMLPPMVQAQALVGSVAKTRSCSPASSMQRSVMTPASTSSTFTRGAGAPVERQRPLGDAADPVELLGVDHHAAGLERHRAAGQAGAGAARDDLEAEPPGRRQERRHLALVVRHADRQREVEAPVGGVGGVGDQREGVEEDVVRPDDGPQVALQPAAPLRQPLHLGPHPGQELAAGGHDLQHHGLARGVPLHHLEVLGRVGQELLAALRRVDQLLEQEGVALVDQHLPQEAGEQLGRAPGDAAGPQLLQLGPGLGAQQEVDGLAVVRGGVVEGDLARQGGGGGHRVLADPAHGAGHSGDPGT